MKIEKESKRILVKFLGVLLLVVSIMLLLRHEKNKVLLGLVVFAIALVVLINYNLHKQDYCINKPEKCSEGIKKKK